MKKTFFLLTGVLFVLLFFGCPNATETPKSNNANLQTLTPSTGTLSPEFNANTLKYTVIVPNGVTSLTVTGMKADPNATMTPGNGELSFTDLSVGASSEKTIKVTAEDSTTTQEYKIKVVKLGPKATTNGKSETISLLPVPPGAFQRDEEAANVSIIVKAYYMSKDPITRQQFTEIMGTDPSRVIYSSGMTDPVQMVNWYHAIAFCNKLSIKEGLSQAYTVSGVNFNTLTYAEIPTTSNATWNAATCDWDADGYRLPTEMEWMWAAMGAPTDGQNGGINSTGHEKPFAGSTGSNSIGDYAWYASNSSTKTHPVGEKKPNELGLCDMSGNVWEWCWDSYASYPTGAQTDYRGAGSGSDRVYRGGSWDRSASSCTVAYRGDGNPSLLYYYRGFRVLRPIL